MRSNPFQKKKEMHRAAEDVGNEVGPQVVGSGTVVEVVGIKSPSKDHFDRLQELQAEVLTTKEGHKELRRLMDKQHQELATLKKEAKEADAARKYQSDKIECLKKQTEADNVRPEELLKPYRLSRPGQ
ncbi:hypothetical protein EJB05_11026, partial [Eragrostis curvula]